MPAHPPLSTLADAVVASSGICHSSPEWHYFPVFCCSGPSHLSKIALAKLDSRRSKRAAVASSEQEKKKRKYQKEVTATEEQRQRALKGDGYGAGQYGD